MAKKTTAAAAATEEHTHAELEKKVAALEKEVAALKKELAGAKVGADPRVDKIILALKSLPSFKTSCSNNNIEL